MNSPADRVFTDKEWRELVEQLPPMSPRQIEIGQYLLQGCSAKQIAPALAIRIPTVRTHMTRLFGKLGVQDRMELVLYVFRTFRAGCPKATCPRRR